jgi:hypothetical protein
MAHVTTGSSGDEPSIVVILHDEDGPLEHLTPREARRVGTDLIAKADDILPVCPLAWCKARADAHDPDDPRVAEHLFPILQDQPFGDVEVLRVYRRTEDGELGQVVRDPAVVSHSLFPTSGYAPIDGQVLAKAFELAAVIAENINAGEWD